MTPPKSALVGLTVTKWCHSPSLKESVDMAAPPPLSSLILPPSKFNVYLLPATFSPQLTKDCWAEVLLYVDLNQRAAVMAVFPVIPLKSATFT